MVESVILGAFAVMLVAGIALGVPIVAILLGGLVLFAGYAVSQGHGAREVASMATSGLRSIREVLVIYLIVGMMCAAWRAAGTIPLTVSVCASLMTPQVFLLAAFLMCCVMSMLMGTASGSAATMGVICMTIASAMGTNRLLAGGAILAGCYFGDRCSPLSGSALLVANLTRTPVQRNVARMARTAAVPFALSCVAYAALGALTPGGGSIPQVGDLFVRQFDLSWVVVLPVVAIVVLSLAHVSVKRTMLASLGLACALCVGVQHMSPLALPGLLLFGYQCPDAGLRGMLDGGGVLSMANMVGIIVVSSTYSGIFDGTGLLNGLCGAILRLSRRYSPFVGVLVTSVVANCMACNQTLSIVLTDQLCRRTEDSGSALALDLENSAVVIAGLVPWSLSCVAVLGFIGAPSTSVVAAVFLYLLPLWTLFLSWEVHHDPRFVAKRPAQLLGLTREDGAGAAAGSLPLAA